MPGELDLTTLISTMEPVLQPEEYVFCFLKNEEAQRISAPCKLRFQEEEGTTLVMSMTAAEAQGLNFTYPCRLITLNTHSSLEAIEFLAAITKHLAAAGISVNPVSAFHHDHLFVPVAQAEIALSLLLELSRRNSAFSFNNLVPELGVSDFRRSLEFYTKLLPFKIEYDRPEKGFAFLSLGSSQIMIEQISGTEAASDQEFREGRWITGRLEYPFGRGTSLSISVDDLEPILQTLAAANYPLKMAPKDAWYRRDAILVGERQILLLDPDGYLLRLQQSLGVKPLDQELL